MPKRRKIIYGEEFYQELGMRLRVARMAKNLSQFACAEMCKVSYQQYQKWEDGVSRVPVLELMHICKTLGYDLKELCTEAYKVVSI